VKTKRSSEADAVVRDAATPTIAVMRRALRDLKAYVERERYGSVLGLPFVKN
jgi:hypothetical protein